MEAYSLISLFDEMRKKFSNKEIEYCYIIDRKWLNK
jgi:hypothetical protein